MEEIRLVRPSMEYEKELLDFRREVTEAGDEDAFAGCSRLEKCDTVEQWLYLLDKMEKAETCPPGKVTSTTYLAVRVSDGRVVGIIDLRHHIDHPTLGLWGGHIGYSVRPSERGKGYAKEMLRLDLQHCRARKIDRVLVTCDRDNTASERTILANGGMFDREVLVDGRHIRRYWIAGPKPG